MTTITADGAASSRNDDLLGSKAASVTATGVEHVFENGFRALQPTDLHVEAGTFCTLLGPSGSGKTTLLRIFAGLVTPTGGKVTIGGMDVTGMPVQQRDIGFVFQHYALFPHMSVAQNIEYPLRVRKMSKDRRAQRVAEMLDLVGLTSFAKSRPNELSGGQQQRVAIARALVYGPRVLLLDEPLGALDRKLRQQLGADMRRIQHETGTTAVYVTHDQEEAFLLSDSVVVMDHGEVRQKGNPLEVYSRPRDLFVAGFLGDTNVLRGTVGQRDTATSNLTRGGRTIACARGEDLAVGADAACSVRPEDIILAPAGRSSNEHVYVYGEGTVQDRIFMGSRHRMIVAVDEVMFHIEVGPGGFAPEPGSLTSIGWAHGSPVLIEIPATINSKG
tara:strand:- start:13332 stop:14495 length:1164 start_codon:yes stop_codon:yes gene_type:complete